MVCCKRIFRGIIAHSTFLICLGTHVFSQAPAISYGGYKLFTKDSVTESFAPVNKGGEVPKTVYSSTITIAGTDFPGSQDGAGIKARFNQPKKIAVDVLGNIYVSDALNNRIRKINPDGSVITIAGNGKASYLNSNIGIEASFNRPSGIAVDKLGNLYIADVFNHVIRKITPSGAVSTLAGSGQPGYKNEKGMLASFSFPVDVAVDEAGNVFVADEGNQRIRKITASGIVSSFAGNGSPGSHDDKTGILAEFNQPNGIAVDNKGNVYVADQLNHKIRKITSEGAVSTLAGSGLAGSADNAIGIEASFNNPRGIAVNQSGIVFVGDVVNQRIRKISPNGSVTTLAGTGAAGSQDNPDGLLAGFYFPNGLAVDQTGNLFIADQLNNKIRKISTTGYSISPQLLPEGLRFDRHTGTFSGTPVTDTINSIYRITAHNIKGSSSAELSISVSSEPGNALSFDGFDDRVFIPDAPSLRSEIVSVECWVNIRKLNAGFGRIVLKRNNMFRYDDSYSIGIDSNFRFTAVMCSGTGIAESQKIARQKDFLETDKWYFLSAVFSKDSIRLFVNGILQNSVFTGFPISHGNNALNLGFDERLNFSLDEVRIFNTDRSAYFLTDMNQPLSPSTTGLVAYYNFNLGHAGGLNTGLMALIDLTTNSNNGVLTNFQPLSGEVSNWTKSFAMMLPQVKEAVDVKSSGFTAVWDKPALGKDISYLLDISTDPLFHSYVKNYHELQVQETTHVVKGLAAGTVYYYRVAAENTVTEQRTSYTNGIKVKTNK